MEAGLLAPASEVFDYGCGRGDDVRLLQQLGIQADGWDPAYQPAKRLREADLVNCGYVVNVIEDTEERAQCLRSAWALARRALVVAARLTMDAKRTTCDAHGDGGVTVRGTFQKFFTQIELRDWIDRTLEATSVAAAPGVFFVFRDPTARQAFLASRYRRQRAAPKLRMSDVLFEQHRGLLEPLIDFMTSRGRLPGDGEMAGITSLREAFGSLRRAFAVIRRVTGTDQWEKIRAERVEEFLLYLALERFGGRPRFSELPSDLQLDVREFFGTYNKACDRADALLFSAGRMDAIAEGMRTSPVGKLTGNALYVHVSALHALPAILRIYEGCARSYIGVVDGANIIKLHRDTPSVSYLLYPRFDEAAHPALSASLLVNLQRSDVQYREYEQSDSPPILHRKEEFVGADYPGRERFQKLTSQEEKRGLYENPSEIGTLRAWEDLLKAKSVCLRGHRLCRLRLTEPESSDGPQEPVAPEASPPLEES
jgi:DNA phosphorothioation-associated putative methyltransferase